MVTSSKFWNCIVDILASINFAQLSNELPIGVSKSTLGKKQLRGKVEEIELITYKRNEI
jgi:hypothetical protein